MLLSAKLPLPKQILIHGFITSGGQKMSKTIGNVIDPFEMVNKYGLEPFRYYLLSQIPIDGDGDFTEEKFREIYNADLANGLGNLCARIAKLCENNHVSVEYETADKFDPEFHTLMKDFKFNEILEYIWRQIKALDVRLNAEKPWELDSENAGTFLKQYVGKLLVISTQLRPFMPETANKIITHFRGSIKAIEPLFPRLDK
jgi:methionyl-tRNA synthetase